MSSTLDELEQIERSARGPPPGMSEGGPRRGSSMFSGGDAMKKYMSSQSNSKGGSTKSSELLEDFPRRGSGQYYSQPAPTKPAENKPRTQAKRGSVALKPMVGLGGLVDFDDSDFDDSEEEEDYNPRNQGRRSTAVGGQNARPLVGGFAAAAYEAARAHHYSNVNKQPTHHSSKRRGPPPSI